jgi:hypothetical protein
VLAPAFALGCLCHCRKLQSGSTRRGSAAAKQIPVPARAEVAVSVQIADSAQAGKLFIRQRHRRSHDRTADNTA